MTDQFCPSSVEQRHRSYDNGLIYDGIHSFRGKKSSTVISWVQFSRYSALSIHFTSSTYLMFLAIFKQAWKITIFNRSDHKTEQPRIYYISLSYSKLLHACKCRPNSPNLLNTKRFEVVLTKSPLPCDQSLLRSSVGRLSLELKSKLI